MAYIIIVEDDNSLYGSCKERIMQKEKLFNKLCFLAAPYYHGYDMSQCKVTMRYLRPISKEFEIETLVLSEERYGEEGYLQYVLPVDTNLTKEYGDIILNLTFIMLDVDDNDNVVQRVRKTDSHILHITKLPEWDSIVPDPALAALDQRIIKMDAQIRALDEINQTLVNTKADNIKYDADTNNLQLIANGNEIGDKVTLKSYQEEVEDALEDGIPVVGF